MDEISNMNESPYNLREITLTRSKPNTVAYGLDTISYKCQEVWNSIPAEITSSTNVSIFKEKIKDLSRAQLNKLSRNRTFWQFSS